MAEFDHADPHATELGDFVAEFVKHEPDLPLQALAQDHAQLQGFDFLDFFHLGASALNVKTA